MSISAYIRSHALDYVLCVVAASALSFTVCSAYYATQPLQAYPFAFVAACALILVLLFAIAYNTRTIVVGGLAFAGLVVAAAVWCVLSNPNMLPLEDVEGNRLLVLLPLVLTPLGVFLLSRRRVGCIILILLGAYICAIIEYLYWYNHIMAAALFLVGAIALLVVRNYSDTVQRAQAGQVAFGSVGITGLGMVLLAALAATSLYILVIAPLNPPSLQVKLFTEYRSAEEIEVFGTGSTVSDASGQDGNLSHGEEQESSQQASSNLFDSLANQALQMLGMDTNLYGDDGTSTMLSPKLVLFFIILGLLLLLALLAYIL